MFRATGIPSQIWFTACAALLRVSSRSAVRIKPARTASDSSASFARASMRSVSGDARPTDSL